jgi:D-arabinitol 2-dehydrogenase
MAEASVPVVAGGYEASRPTLSSFSLSGRVTVITGGAQGLGLVMSRAIALSGSNVALVDLNSMCP